MASMLPEGLTSRWLSGEEVSGDSWRAVSIGSGLGCLSSEVSGKIIGMEKDLACGDPAERLGSGITRVMRSLVPFLTFFFLCLALGALVEDLFRSSAFSGVFFCPPL